MYHVAQLAESDTGGDCGSQLGNHLARMARDDRRTDNLVAAAANVHLHESVRLPIEHGTIHFRQFLRVSIDFDSALRGFGRIQSDVRDFGIGVRTPWNSKSANTLTAEE